jgi:hypothetical protein
VTGQHSLRHEWGLDLTDKSAKELAIRRFIVFFLASATLFGAQAWLGGGHFNFLQSAGIVIGGALVIGVAAVLLGAFLGNVPRSGKTK